jgi:FMN phosphatase YigB (HAD superfamily)
VNPTPRALLFDLGNVVIEIDFGRSLAAWHALAGRGPATSKGPMDFDFDDEYRAHEAGLLDADAYFAHVARKFGLPADAAAIRDGWNALFVRAIDDTVAAIDAVRDRIPCHALSNTNATHIDAVRARFPGLLERFGTLFASHELRMRKPEARLFQHVLRCLDLPAQDVLFFDDLAENVDAARTLGFQAELVTQPGDVRRALRERGLM